MTDKKFNWLGFTYASCTLLVTATLCAFALWALINYTVAATIVMFILLFVIAGNNIKCRKTGRDNNN